MSSFEEKMAELRGRFISRCAEDEALIRSALDEMNKAELRRLAHGLSGSAGTFGFAELSLDAQALEEAVDEEKPAAEIRSLGFILLDRLESLQAV